MPGTLVFKPIEANLNIKDKDLLGKMDPYCLFHVGGNKVKSQVCKNGGQNPHWNDAIQVQMPDNSGVVNVDLKDKDMLIDDKLGSFQVDLNEVASLGQVRKWYPIFSKDRPAGEILIETTFNGSGYSQGVGQQGFVQQQHVGQQYHQGQGQILQGSQVIHGGQLYHGHQNPGTVYQGQQGFIGGIPVSSSTTTTKFIPPGGEAVLSEVHEQPGTHTYTQQHTTYQQHQPIYHHQTLVQSQYPHGYPQQQPIHQSGGVPMHFSGRQVNVVPVGGIPSGVEQYATEALMRGVDPINTQQHYHYNIANGSRNPGFTGIPMNYSSGVSGNLLNQTPQSLTQTPLYSGSQPLNYEGGPGHSEVFTNTHTTGHHNEGFMSKIQQKVHRLEEKWGTHSTHKTETKNYSTGMFHSNTGPSNANPSTYGQPNPNLQSTYGQPNPNVQSTYGNVQPSLSNPNYNKQY